MKYLKLLLIIVGLSLMAYACGSGGGDGGYTPPGSSSTTTTPADKITVTGTVVDEAGNPVSGATITINSDPVITTSDNKGNFSAEVVRGEEHSIVITLGDVIVISSNFTCNSSPCVFNDITYIRQIDLLLVEHEDSQIAGLLSSDDGVFVFYQREEQNGQKRIAGISTFDNNGHLGDILIYNDGSVKWSSTGARALSESKIQTELKVSSALAPKSQDLNRGIKEALDSWINGAQDDLKTIPAYVTGRFMSMKLGEDKYYPKTYVSSRAISCVSNFLKCAYQVANSYFTSIGKNNRVIEIPDNLAGIGTWQDIAVQQSFLSIRDSEGQTVKMSDQCGFTASPTSGVAPLDVLLAASSLNFNGTGLSHKWEYGSAGSSRTPVIFGSGDEAFLSLATSGTYKVNLTVSFKRGGGFLCQSEKLITVEEPRDDGGSSLPQQEDCRFVNHQIDPSCCWIDTSDEDWVYGKCMCIDEYNPEGGHVRYGFCEGLPGHISQ